jgi:uncharacterized protein (TIGR03435 family)
MRIMLDGAVRKLDRSRKLLLSMAALAAITIPIGFGVIYAAPRLSSHGRRSQSGGANVPDYKYEVASIKSTKSRPNSHHSDTTGDEYRAANVTLMRLIREGYLFQFGPGSDDGRVVGGPSWLDSDGFDLDAKIDSSTVEALNKLAPAEREAARERMLRSLLAERFKLVVHTETREFPVYVLTLAKNGPKFHEAKAGETYENAYKLPDGSPAGPGFHTDNETAAGQNVAMETLAGWLSRRLGRTVVDRTGLAGKYDFKFSWTRDEGENSSDPLMSPILGAIQQQLGLKLESGKGPVDVIVIDHAEKPSGN